MALVKAERTDDGVVTVVLNDPDRRNAMGHAMCSEMVSLFSRLSEDPDVRALVVTGQGEGFCSGADLPELFGAPERATVEVHGMLQRYYRAFLMLREMPFPTIAAVNGAAIGAGLNLAMACDVRILGRHARLGATFTRIGLHPGGGCTWFLVQALGRSRALITLLRGDVIDADQAARWGLGEGPEDDCVEAARSMAAEFAVVDPQLARHVTRAVKLADDSGNFGSVLEYESWAQAASASSEQLRDWVARFADDERG